MQIPLLILAIVLTVTAPYGVIMSVPKTSHAMLAAIAIAVPTAIAYRQAEPPRFVPHDWVFGVDGLLLAATLASIGLAIFVRAVVASLGDRARGTAAMVTIHILGVAIVAGALPWVSEWIHARHML